MNIRQLLAILPITWALAVIVHAQDSTIPIGPHLLSGSEENKNGTPKLKQGKAADLYSKVTKNTKDPLEKDSVFLSRVWVGKQRVVEFDVDRSY